MRTARVVLSSLLAAAAVLLVACEGTTPVGPRAPARLSQGDFLAADRHSRAHLDLLPCEPDHPDWAAKVIGPQGGELKVGKHTLTVPVGSLHERVTISAIARYDGLNHIEFQPEGLVFDRPVTLTMSYENCTVPSSVKKVRIAYTDAALNIIDHLFSDDDKSSRQVRSQLKHFSEYAVAW